MVDPIEMTRGKKSICVPFHCNSKILARTLGFLVGFSSICCPKLMHHTKQEKV